MWTWAQLGFYQKPLGLLGARVIFAPLPQFLDLLVAQRLLVAAPAVTKTRHAR
jgi:predicted Rossmann-fold nucleotide-binding protein